MMEKVIHGLHGRLLRRIGRHALIAALSLAASAGFAYSQYFGQNKVRYETFDFQVLQTEHFDIYYYEEERAATEMVARMAERWYERLSSLLSHELPPNQPIVLYDSHPAFRGTTVIPGFIGDTTGGVTEGLRRRIVMPLAGAMQETDHVLGHELVHAFQYDITTPVGGSGAGMPGIARLPLWFVEGMAEYLSIGPEDPHTAMWMRDAVQRDEIPEIKKLDHPRYFPYRYGHAVWAYIGGRYGDEAVGEMLRVGGSSGSPATAIQSVLGVSIEAFSEAFSSELQAKYAPALAATNSADEEATPIRKSEEDRTRLYVSPVISPDGRYVAFFSEKDLFSIDLYVAETATGDIVEKLTETAIDPHFDSLQFVSSAGAWSPDGNRFVFGAIGKGRPELHIYDMERGDVVQRIRFADLGEIFSPAWSSDGKTLAFTAIKGGLLDLFTYDLETEQRRQLTDDAFAEMQPSFSPDGNTLVFVTDRFTSDVENISYRGTRLALMRLQDASIGPLEAFNAGKHIDPQFDAGGENVYFVSDQDGISNIYRIPRSGGAPVQVTNLETGVSGITAMSPAFSIARNAQNTAFSVYRNGGYDLYGISEESRLAGRPPNDQVAALAPGVLPPRDRAAGPVANVLSNQQAGLPRQQSFERKPYEPSLKLDYVAQPSVSVGLSSFGALVGGGTALYFSDMLGRHNLMTSFQSVSNTGRGNLLNSISAVAGYENHEHRWTWGVIGGQVPYMSGGYGQFITTVEGQPVLVEDETLFWQIERQVNGLAAYPFNRAQRIEFSAGYRNISFDVEQRRNFFDPTTGQFLGTQEAENLQSPDGLNMGTFGTALVYDTSLFGGVSPVRGQRYRIEFGGTGGDLTFAEGLFDYRRYFQPFRSLTLAGRLLHFGRYGGDAEDPRQQPLFLGYPTLVRGYKPGSFSVEECGAQFAESGQCPVYDQLLGSRLGTLNLEARVPMIGALGLWRTPSLPPVELAAFFDGGVAWNSNSSPTFTNGSRSPVSSYGASLRANAMGFLIVQISYVHPNDRPMQDWVWEFSLTPGF